MTMWTPNTARRAGARYIAIADALAADIQEGRLKAGDRLPTHRDLASRLSVTVGTITRAYGEAQRRGLISGEVGRGSFVRPPAGQGSDRSGSPTDLVDLSANYLDGGNQSGMLSDTLRDLSVAQDLGALIGYQPTAGRPAHRAAGARWIARRGLDARPEQILICSGAQHAMTIVFTTLMQPGDLLLTEALTYAGMKTLATLLHLRIQGVAMDAEGVRPDALDTACRQGQPRALYCMPTVQNPTTAVMGSTRRREIVEIARAYDLAIVEDDTYGFVASDVPIAAIAPERTYYILSTSKSLAPALRIGYLLAPHAMVDRLAAAICTTVWMASPVAAEITTRWIVGGSADALVKWKCQEAAARLDLARKALQPYDFQAHACGQHLWLHLPPPWRSEDFAAEARRRGILVTPAEIFATDVGVPFAAVRVCLGTPATRVELGLGLTKVAELLAGVPAAAMPVV